MGTHYWILEIFSSVPQSRQREREVQWNLASAQGTKKTRKAIWGIPRDSRSGEGNFNSPLRDDWWLPSYTVYQQELLTPIKNQKWDCFNAGCFPFFIHNGYPVARESGGTEDPNHAKIPHVLYIHSPSGNLHLQLLRHKILSRLALQAQYRPFTQPHWHHTTVYPLSPTGIIQTGYLFSGGQDRCKR